jgi:hypothetical protein
VVRIMVGMVLRTKMMERTHYPISAIALVVEVVALSVWSEMGFQSLIVPFRQFDRCLKTLYRLRPCLTQLFLLHTYFGEWMDLWKMW